jgi:hypothetical protein
LINWSQWLITAATVIASAAAIVALISNRMQKDRNSFKTSITLELGNKLDRIGDHLVMQDKIQNEQGNDLKDLNMRVARIEGRLGIGAERIRDYNGGDPGTPPRNERPVPRIQS